MSTLKSVTPKEGVTWYVKWASSILMLTAVTFRATGLPELAIYDIIFSWLGAVGWFYVSIKWNDRALIVLNGVFGVILFTGLIKYFLA